jgi:PKD repeat protein
VNAYFTPSSTVLCAGDCITFNNQTTGVATSWNWTFPGSTTPSSSQQQPGNICYNTPGIYPVTLTATNATLTDVHTDTIYVGQAFADTVNASICLGDVYTFPDGTTSQANTTHVSSLTGSFGCDSIITTNLSVFTLDTTVTNNGVLSVNAQIATVQWVNCGAGYAPVPGQTAYTFYPLTTGNYAAILTNGGCTDTSGCHYIITLGTNEPSTLNISVYPNPADGELTVTFKNGVLSDDISILDVTGREYDIRFRRTAGGVVITTADLSAGYYLLKAGDARMPFVKR